MQEGILLTDCELGTQLKGQTVAEITALVCIKTFDFSKIHEIIAYF